MSVTSASALRLAVCAMVLGAWLGQGSARAQSCPGAGTQSCPYASASIVGGSPPGVMRYPEAVAIGPEGSLYVADQLSYQIMRFSQEGLLEAQWGSYGGGPGQFGPIGAIAVGGSGDVYVVDSSHNRIEEFGPAGEYITSWGSGGSELGQFRFGSSENPTQPPGGGIAVSGDYVYVSDTVNDRVERFNLQGGEAMQFASGGFGPGQVSAPRGLAANASVLYLADDDNDRIDEFGLGGEYLGSFGSRGTGPGQFEFPYGVALDAAGNIYVADDENDRVDEFSPQFAFTRMWGSFGSGSGQLAFPRAIASDAAGDTYVANTANDRVDMFNSTGGYVRSYGIPASAAGVLSAPRGLSVDPTGRLLVADTFNNRVDLFAPFSQAFEGAWSAASETTPAPSAPGAPPGEQGSVRGLTSPLGIAVATRGDIYVEDTAHHRLTQLWGDGTYLSVLGAVEGASALYPGAVATSPSGSEIYVADTAKNRILVYGPEGALLARWGADDGDGASGSGPGQFDSPRGIAVDAAGDIYVADFDNERIEKLSSSGEFIGEWGVRGTKPGHFENPAGIAIDPSGRVYVTDYGNDRVEIFASDGAFIGEWGLRGTALGYFSQPTAIALGCEGSVYVADTNNNRVERFSGAAADGHCLAAGSWPPPLEVAPVVHITLLHRSGILARAGLGLQVSCVRGCRVRLTGSLATTKPRVKVKLLKAVRSLMPNHRSAIDLRLEHPALRTLRRNLAHHNRMTARIQIIAIGPGGKRTVVRKTYALKR